MASFGFKGSDQQKPAGVLSGGERNRLNLALTLSLIHIFTRDDWLILSSEVGTIDVDPANVLQAGCLGPGEMLEVDPGQGRVIWNDEIRNRYANEKPCLLYTSRCV